MLRLDTNGMESENENKFEEFDDKYTSTAISTHIFAQKKVLIIFPHFRREKNLTENNVKSFE